MFAPNQRCEAFTGDDLKPTMSLSLFDHAIERQRGRDPFQFWTTPVFALKQPFDQAIRGCADHYFIGIGHSLHPSGDVRRLAQCELLMTAASADLSDHD